MTISQSINQSIKYLLKGQDRAINQTQHHKHCAENMDAYRA